MRDTRPLIDRVIAFLSTAEACQFNAAAVSNAVYASGSNMRRHLRDSGTSLQTLMDIERAQRAAHLLTQGHRPKCVGYELGFTGQKSFYRWFQKTFGVSISKWRQQMRARLLTEMLRSGLEKGDIARALGWESVQPLYKFMARYPVQHVA